MKRLCKSITKAKWTTLLPATNWTPSVAKILKGVGETLDTNKFALSIIPEGFDFLVLFFLNVRWSSVYKAKTFS